MSLSSRRWLAALASLGIAAEAALAQTVSGAASAAAAAPSGAAAAGSAALVRNAPAVLLAPTAAPLTPALSAVPQVAVSISPSAARVGTASLGLAQAAVASTLALPQARIAPAAAVSSPARALTSAVAAARAEPRGSSRAGSIGALRAIAPRLAAGRVAAALDWLFTGRSLDSAALSAAPAAVDPPPVPARKLSIEEWARAGEQAYYEGRLKEGEHGAVVAPAPRQAPQGQLPDEGELRRRMELPTLTNPQREEKAIELLQLAGAGKEVVTLRPGEKPTFDRFHTIIRQDAGRGRHNFIVVKPGRRADKVIVVGAHHDKVDVGEGKIDNWSGTTMMANLYQAMKDEDTEATYVFVMFSREEEGLIGSDVFVRSLAPELKGRIRAMVNVDTVGVDGTFSWKNNSSRYLLDLIARVAKATSLDLREIVLHGGDADSSSFKRFTPAMTIFGASPDVIWDILHSENDNMGAFSLPHYVNATKLTLALLRALDKEDPPRVQEAAAARALLAGLPGRHRARAAAMHPYRYEYLRRARLEALKG